LRVKRRWRGLQNDNGAKMLKLGFWQLPSGLDLSICHQWGS
jgi:hypothetical protein